MRKERINHFRNEFRFLSNFTSCDVVYEGRVYSSVEHAYQALKTEIDTERRWVGDASTPGKAKRRGQNIHLRKDWGEVKLEMMLLLVRQKFGSDPLKRKLLDTGDAELVEGNWWGDTFWGPYNGKGENHLGKILMKVREERRRYDSEKGD